MSAYARLQQWATGLTFQSLIFSIGIFTHLKLCLADAIHNFKWVKIIQIWQNLAASAVNRGVKWVKVKT